MSATSAAAMDVVLVDLHGAVAAAAEGWAAAEKLAWTDVRDVPAGPGTAFVSPANSLGFMDGGIDYVLSRIMFPGVEGAVKTAFERSGSVTRLGRPYLPIGRAVVVPTCREGVSLVSAPTMWLPQDVRGTHNAYHATYAALEAAAAAGVRRIVFPGMGTGCGMLPYAEAAAQMQRAHGDFCSGRPPQFDEAAIAEEQPLWFENTEFKDIDAHDVQFH